jgi:hypothetical protein
MVFNATFNNISIISWRSVLLVEETERPGENHRPAASHRQTLSHNVVHLPWNGVEHTTSVVIGTDCIGSCKSNYHTITATTTPASKMRDHVCVLGVWILPLFLRSSEWTLGLYSHWFFCSSNYYIIV